MTPADQATTVLDALRLQAEMVRFGLLPADEPEPTPEGKQ